MDLLAKWGDVVYLIGARDDYAVGATETGERFAQAAVREQMPAAPRVGCVDGDDVQVALETEVLEAVVQDKTTGAESRDCFTTGGDAIGAADHRGNAEQIGGEQKRFVAGCGWIREYGVAV